MKAQIGNDSQFETPALHPEDIVVTLGRLKWAVTVATEAVDGARQKCLAAGALANEAKARCDHGDFMDWAERNLPVKHRTLSVWMNAAANVCRAIANRQAPGTEVIDVEASFIISAADADLTEGQREWRQAWFDFTADKTIKECLAGVFVDGDEDHRVDRAVNGKFARGAGGSGDRKDFADFSLRKLRHLNTFFGSWQSMTERQRTEIKDEFAAAICGEEFKLRGRPGEDHTTPVRFDPWPEDVCEVAMEAIRARLKGRN